MRTLGISLLALLAVGATTVVAVSEKPPVDYTTIANQAILYQAASAVGVLAYCERAFEYTVPKHADEVAFGKLSAIFGAAERGSPLHSLGLLTYRILRLSSEQGGWLQVGVAGENLKPLGMVKMDSRQACDGAQEYLEVLMQKGGLLDVKGTRDLPEANAAPGGGGIGSRG